MSLRFPIKLFTSIPVRCPVRVERGRRAGEYIRTDELGWIEVKVDGGVLSFGPAEVWVDMARSGADIRAYVPDLILAVAGLPEGMRPFKEPVALWDNYGKEYTLVDHICTLGIARAHLAGDPVTGKTREECLLNGLIVALNAAKT